MAQNLQHITFNLSAASGVRQEQLEGRPHVVVPMVMLAEGVHKGSLGPLYYPTEELGKTPAVWNHKPVVVNHPEIDGQGISACDPDVLNTHKIGVILNTRFEAGKLKAEAWIERQKADKVDPRIMRSVDNGQTLELSTGLFTDNQESEGVWNGSQGPEEYVAVARNYRPDHLAILPDKTGAFSIADGAGFLRNQREREAFAELVLNVINTREAHNMAQQNKEAKVVGLINNKATKWAESDKSWLMTLSDDQLDKLQPDPPQQQDPNNPTGQQTGQQPGQQATQQGQPGQTPPQNAPQAPQQPQTGQQGQTAAQGQQGQQGANTGVTQPNPQQGGQQGNQPTGNAQQGFTWDQWMQQAPPEYREMVANGMQAHNEQKTQLVDLICNSPSNVFTREWLANQSLPALKGMAALAQTQSSQVYQQQGPPMFLGAGTLHNNPAHNQASDDEPLIMPVMNFQREQGKQAS